MRSPPFDTAQPRHHCHRIRCCIVKPFCFCSWSFLERLKSVRCWSLARLTQGGGPPAWSRPKLVFPGCDGTGPLGGGWFGFVRVVRLAALKNAVDDVGELAHPGGDDGHLLFLPVFDKRF